MNSPTRRTPTPIGKYFLDAGRITGDQLEQALDYKHDHGGKLGQALVGLGFVTEAELVDALRQQRKVHCVNLRPELVDTQVALSFGESRSRKFRALALNRIADYITVAMEDPADVYAIDAMTRHLGAKVWPVFAEPSKIQDSIEHIFSNRVVPGGASFDYEHGGSLALPRESLAFGPSGAASSGVGLFRVEPNTTAPPVTAVQPVSEPEPEPQPRPARVAKKRKPTELDADEATRNLIRNTLQEAFLQGASDVHLEPRSDAFLMRYRVDGMLFDRARLERGWQTHLVRGLKRMAGLQAAESLKLQEGRAQFSYKNRTIDIRVGILPSVHGEGAVITILEGRRPLRSLESLELANTQLADLERSVQSRDGLILATGPAKSGRSTTLYSLLDRLSKQNKKIITLEDPVEHVFDGATQINVNPSSGQTFTSGLRTILRMDPDVVLVDDIREAETAEIAAEGALEGHLILACMHTAGAVESISRLVELGVDVHLIADTLRCSIGQRLLRRVCSACSRPAQIDRDVSRTLGIEPEEIARFREGDGCEACMNTGYKGRVAIYEVLTIDSKIRDLLRGRASMEVIQRCALDSGMLTLKRSALNRAFAGQTTLEEVLSVTNRP